MICTSKRRGVLEELGLLSMFTAILRVPYIKDAEDVRMVLDESQAMTAAEVSNYAGVVSVFFLTALPCSGGYYLERGGMPLHDAVRSRVVKNRFFFYFAQPTCFFLKNPIKKTFFFEYPDLKKKTAFLEKKNNFYLEKSGQKWVFYNLFLTFL